MAGDITIETERGVIIDSAPVWIGAFCEHVEKCLASDRFNQTHCLQFIDPYGDTTFNGWQMRALIEELEDLVRTSDCVDAKPYFQPIIDFISKYKNHIHTYVKFHGD